MPKEAYDGTYCHFMVQVTTAGSRSRIDAIALSPQAAPPLGLVTTVGTRTATFEPMLLEYSGFMLVPTGSGALSL